jgi:sortase A
MRWAIAGLIGLALWQFSEGAYIHAKALLAQYLVRAAWEKTLAGQREVKPWPWADTWPVARLAAPRLGAEVYVLAGASGRTLAFGPGHLPGTAAPGEPGNAVISAHRDTHFAFLRELKTGDELLVETPKGDRRSYFVTAAEVVDKHDLRVVMSEERAWLTLVTCYPFDAINPRGPLRYVVRARLYSPGDLEVLGAVRRPDRAR